MRPTRWLIQIAIGSTRKENSAKRHSSTSMAITVITTVLTLRVRSLAVWVTKACRPPMSLAMRDWTSPVRVVEKKPSESDCRCA